MYTAPQLQDLPDGGTLHGYLTHISNGRPGIMQTLHVMRQLVLEGRRNLAVRQAAVNASFMVPEKDAFAEVQAIFEFVRDSIRYTSDILDVETVTAADKTLQLRYGDCDDQVVLLCAMFESISYPTRFVVAGYTDPKSFEHVYCEVLANGVWVSCDPTEPNALGWSAPLPLITYTEGT